MLNPELNLRRADSLNTLRDWVGDTFSECTTVEQFIVFFNDYFRDYQDYHELKLDPKSISSGNHSCSSASLTAGLWWSLMHPDFSPYFLVEENDKVPHFKLHTCAVLPLINGLSEFDVKTELKSEHTSTVLIALDLYSVRSSYGRTTRLRRTDKKEVPTTYTFFENIDNFYLDRCNTFKYLEDSDPVQPTEPSSSPSIRSVLVGLRSK